MARVCTSCTKGFSSAVALNEHKRLWHTRERKYECSGCTQSFSSFGRMVMHVRKTH